MDKLVDSLIFVKSSELLIEPEKKWFEHKFKNEPTSATIATEYAPIKDLETISALREYARKLFEQDKITYNQFREKTRRSDHNWIRTVLKTGTIGDKISANTILIQDSAVHNLDSLESLIASVKLNKKRECMLAIDALKDLFANQLLPKRALRSFHEHPFGYLLKFGDDKTSRDKRLLLFYFESLIKMKYTSFIKNLQEVFQDTLAATKTKVAATIFELVAANPNEQQKVLFEMLVNKLGDPDYKVASQIVYHITNYLKKHPKSKMSMLLEIERLVSRQNINQRAQYYGFCCMNQLMLSRSDTDVANRLLLIYFAFFKKFIKTKEIDTRMLNALLTGVNRAYIYAKMDHEEIENNLNTLFKLVHVTSFNVSIQALMLLNQVIKSREDVMNRYFNALYRRMFDLEWRNTAKQTYFLNLLYNSLAKDQSLTRMKAFVKRLLQICFSQNAPFVCGAFMLISELMSKNKGLFQLDHGLLVKNNILAVKNGKNGENNDDDDEEEEKFVDVKSQSDDEDQDNEAENEKEGEEEKEEETSSTKKSDAAKTSWMHKSNITFKRHDKYDFMERNPLYCGADKTLSYELLLFTKHYHPSVVVFATKMMNNEPIEYTGDPLEDFTVMHFLDRFVYKNPKKAPAKGKKSVFQAVKSIRKSKVRNIAVNSDEYLKLDPSQIPEEEKFFYNYYKSQQKKKPDDADIDSDANSVSDTEFDAFLSKTEVDGADGNDEDWTLNFADALTKKSKRNQKRAQDSDDDSDDDDDDDEDEEEFEKSMMDEMVSDDDADSDDDDAKNLMLSVPKKKRGKEDLSKLFAAADEFSHMISESNKFESMGLGSISNTDNSDAKQLKWELKRDDEFSGGARKRKKTAGGSFNNNSNKKKKSTFKPAAAAAAGRKVSSKKSMVKNKSKKRK